MKAAGTTELSGENAFKLYDTFGFPTDLTQEILEEKGFTMDEAGFGVCMQHQRETARKARKTTNYMGADVTVYESIDASVTTQFVGYDRLRHDSKITVLTTESELVEALTDGQTGTIIVEETPFYATMGGQNADTGVITTADGSFQVRDTVKLLGGKVGHIGIVTKGMLKVRRCRARPGRPPQSGRRCVPCASRPGAIGPPPPPQTRCPPGRTGSWSRRWRQW